MPYIIAVLALIILGTGYTLFQKSDTPLPEPSDIPLSVIDTKDSSTTNSFLAENPQDQQFVDIVDIEETKESETTPAPNPSPKNTNNPTPAPTPNPVPTPSTPAPADNNTYRNGTYYATKSYRTPDGTYQMNVSATIKDDTITASTLSFDADGSRDGYSKRFNSGYQSQIIGKDLSNASLSRVGGASLTTNAFNSALSSIKSQAS